MAQSDLIAKIDGIEKFQKERSSGGGNQQKWPSQERCGLLKDQVREVLAAIGAKGAYISDVSMFGDFEGLWGVTDETPKAEADSIAQVKCKEISEKLQLGLDEVKPTDYIVEVAQKLKTKTKTVVDTDPLLVVQQSHNDLISAIMPKRSCGTGGCGCK